MNTLLSVNTCRFKEFLPMGINCTKFRSGQKNGKGVRQPDRGWSPWYSCGFALAKFLPLAVAVCECCTNTGKRYVCFESPTLLHVQSALIQFEYSHDADFSSSYPFVLVPLIHLHCWPMLHLMFTGGSLFDSTSECAL